MAACAAALLASITTGVSHAAEYECKSEAETRYIRLELPGEAHLCEVSVTSDEERRVMWYANHDTLFCSDKIIELTTKYEEQWGFSCEQWPDHDGISALSVRQRTILDAELKFLMASSAEANPPLAVSGVKVAASQRANASASMQLSSDKKALQIHSPSTLVIQFFLSALDGSDARDQTHVIEDDGVSWNTRAKLAPLASNVEVLDGYKINSALIDGVTDAGAIEIATQVQKIDSNNITNACYGSQVLSSAGGGELVARTPHRFVCTEAGLLAGYELPE